MKRSKKVKSDFDEFVANPKRKALLEKQYQELSLSEILLTLMDQEAISIRALARNVGVSPAVIQDIRSGKRTNITLKKLLALTSALGAEITIKKGKDSFLLS